MFQFLDVLPSLRTPAQTVRVLREYFSDEATPESLRIAIGMLPQNRISAEVMSTLIRRQAQSFAGQFIVSDTVSGSLRPLQKLWDDGRAFSVDLHLLRIFGSRHR